jgi:Fur family ferric uptake transcriptional regulator
VGRGGHFDAEDLYESCRRAGQNVSRATVYRTLGHLRDCGLVKEVLREHGRSSYETVYGHDHHDHMLCVACGGVIEFCDDRIEDLQQRICRRHGFKPLDHRMGIRGLCRDCRRAERRKGS